MLKITANHFSNNLLKVLTENNSKAIELFQQEAKVLSQLNSAGIPEVELDGYFTDILDCIASQDISTQECDRIKKNVAVGGQMRKEQWRYKPYLVYVCPSCVVAHDENNLEELRQIYQ